MCRSIRSRPRAWAAWLLAVASLGAPACHENAARDVFVCVDERGRTIATSTCPDACAYQCAIRGAGACLGTDCRANCRAATEDNPTACTSARYLFWRCTYRSGRASIQCGDARPPALDRPSDVCEREAEELRRACPAPEPARDAGTPTDSGRPDSPVSEDAGPLDAGGSAPPRPNANEDAGEQR